MDKKSIKHWPEQDKPREKVMAQGVAALSDSELLAILIGTGTTDLSAIDVARNLLAAIDQKLYSLPKLSLKEIQKVKGIGIAKAITIVSAIELGRRVSNLMDIKNPVTDSKSSAALFDSMKYLLREEFWIACLNAKLIPLWVGPVHIGGLGSVMTDLRVIFKIALEQNATKIIVAHNHPSGNPKPSKEDQLVTDRVKAVGELMDIKLLDHVIIAEGGYYSFMDEGMM